MEPEALLLSLQHGDSFFPAGGIAFSWGLESLRGAGAIRTADDLARFIRGQLLHRWATCDRPVLVAAHAAGDDLAVLSGLDDELEAATLARELREGSRRAGASLLGVHARLGTTGAKTLRDAVRSGRARGHLPVAQGCVWRGAGLDRAACETVSAHALCIGLIGAALRLGVIGHLQGQQLITATRPLLIALLETPAPSVEDIHACVPATEIASMWHEVQSSRLFAN